MGIIRSALDRIRADVAPWGVEIPRIPELDGAAVAH
jgi:hypothetical protein